ncbi:hypothetical protein [Thiolapillus sp.]
MAHMDQSSSDTAQSIRSGWRKAHDPEAQANIPFQVLGEQVIKLASRVAGSHFVLC